MTPTGRIGAGGLLLVLGLAGPAQAQPQEKDRGGSTPKQERQEAPRQEQQRQEPARQEPQRQEPARQEPARQEPARQEPQRQEPRRQEPARQEPQRQQPQRQQQAPPAPRAEPQRAQQPQRQEPPRASVPKAPAPSAEPQRAQHQEPQRASVPKAPPPAPQAARPERHEVPAQAAWNARRAGNWRTEHRSWQDRGGYRGYRIPEARYQVAFGPEHFFRLLSYPVLVVGGFPRFQYGGFWVTVLDPWPEYWDTEWYGQDDVYVGLAEGGYYLSNRRYPGDRLAVSISLE